MRSSARVEVAVRRARVLVRALHVGDREPGRLAHREHLRRRREGIGHRRGRRRDRIASRVRRSSSSAREHEAAADRIEGALGERPRRRVERAEDHAVGVAGQRRPVVEDDVGLRIEGDVRQADRGEALRLGERGENRRHAIGIDRVRRLAGERQRDRAVGAVALAGEGERAVQADRQPARSAGERAEILLDETARGHHRPDRVRARRADADLEDVEDAEKHRATFAINPSAAADRRAFRSDPAATRASAPATARLAVKVNSSNRLRLMWTSPRKDRARDCRHARRSGTSQMREGGSGVDKAAANPHDDRSCALRRRRASSSSGSFAARSRW